MLKLLALVMIVVTLLVVGVATAQIVPVSNVIARLTGDREGGWVKIDKSPHSPGYQRVYCVKIDGSTSCDWSDVRRIHVYTISE